jgi:hypothetical protein
MHFERSIMFFLHLGIILSGKSDLTRDPSINARGRDLTILILINTGRLGGWTTSPNKKKLRPVLFSRSPLDYVGFSSRGKDSSSMKLC